LPACGARVEVLGLVGGLTAEPLAAEALQLAAPCDKGFLVRFVLRHAGPHRSTRGECVERPSAPRGALG
jgi:hypothetical protein